MLTNLPVLLCCCVHIPKSPELFDEYLEPTVSDPDNHTYKHYVPSLVSVLWNSTIKEHAFEKNAGDGYLDFDSHAAQKWGFAWKERLKCNKCGFVGKFHKLYYEEKLSKSSSYSGALEKP